MTNDPVTNDPVTNDPVTNEIALDLRDVSVVRQGNSIVDDVNWTVRDGERWVLLGPNGSGKTTLMRLASMYLTPTSGTIDVLGERIGRVDVRRHRLRVGVVSAALAEQFRRTLTAEDIVVCALNAALEPWWHTYSDEDRARAASLLAKVGCGYLAEREYATFSSGERQRVQLARTLMTDPGLLLLDEPAAGLDLGGRELLLALLDELAAEDTTRPTVLITHHLEEIPTTVSHAVLLRNGGIVGQGPVDQTITSESISDTFGLRIDVANEDGRWRAAHRR